MAAPRSEICGLSHFIPRNGCLELRLDHFVASIIARQRLSLISRRGIGVRRGNSENSVAYRWVTTLAADRHFAQAASSFHHHPFPFNCDLTFTMAVDLSPSPQDSLALTHVKSLWASMRGRSPIYDFLILSLDDVEIIDVSPGVVKIRLTLLDKHVNSRGSLHGSVTATIVDFFGGLVIATHGFEKTGVSADIHVTYLSPALVGDVVEIEAITLRQPRTMGFTSINISKVVDGELGPLVATATHTKYIRPRA